MRIVSVLAFLLFTASAAGAAEYAPGDELYDTREAVSDSNTVTRVGNRLSTQPGLHECRFAQDCAIIEGVCSGSEAVNVERAAAKQQANRNARSVAACEYSNPDPDFSIWGADCINNECVLTKRRR